MPTAPVIVTGAAIRSGWFGFGVTKKRESTVPSISTDDAVSRLSAPFWKRPR